MHRGKTVLSLVAGCAALSFPVLSFAQVNPDDKWTFVMLDSSNAPQISTLTINLGTFTQGSLPSGMTTDIFGQIANDMGSPDPLILSGFATGFSGGGNDLDGQTFFTATGNGIGDVVTPGGSDGPINLGTFDESAFLNALPADGLMHDALLDLSFSADVADSNGNDTGNVFGNQPDITPGPPSLLIEAIVTPSGPAGPVPEPGSVALLLAMGASGAGFLRLRRK